jgi:hypothetical protein
MATYYWVGGSGNWNATSTTNWASSSGGAGGAGVPTSADDVIFDGNSNVGTNAFTVTITGTSTDPARCNNFNANTTPALDATMTFSMANATYLEVYGDFLLPSTNFTTSLAGGADVRFLATGKSVTITTNGRSMSSANIRFSGVGATFNLGSAFTGNNITIPSGTFTTNNFSLTSIGGFASTGNLTRTLNFGSSAISVNTSGSTGFAVTGSNLTFNAGTSTITDTSTTPILQGGGRTFNNYTVSSSSVTSVTITGANTFNNVNFSGRGSSSTPMCVVSVAANQTITGTLTLGNPNDARYRLMLCSDVVGVQRTLTVNTVATLSDIDFRDIVAAGASGTWSGTRLGDCKNNTNITFPAPKNSFFRNTGSTNWNSVTGWSLTSGGTATSTAFPLPQDTAIFPAATYPASGSTITVNANYNIGTIDMSLRTSNTMTLAFGSTTPNIYGNFINGSGTTLTGVSATITFAGQGVTQTITPAGKTFPFGIELDSPGGVLATNAAFTHTGTFTFVEGTLRLNAGSTASFTSFVTTGTELKYLESTVNGTRANISDSSGTNAVTYLSIKDSNGTGGATWDATGVGNIDAGNNLGWLFPAASTGNFLFFFS